LSEISKLSGGTLKVKIGNADLELKPLNFKEREVYKKFIASSSKKFEEQVDIQHDFIVAVLKKSYPDATDAEIDAIGFNYYGELTDAVLKVNGMEVSKEDLERFKEARLKKMSSEA